MLQFFLALSLSVLLCQQPANGEGVFISYGGYRLINFRAGTHGDTATIDGESRRILTCETDNSSCCGRSDNPYGRGLGQWYYPNGEMVVSCSEDLPDEQLYIQQRGPRNIRLVRVVNESNITAAANGIYRCEVPDKNGVIQTSYVGKYTETTDDPNGVGVISISEGPDFSLICDNPLVFVLTTITTGGPPAYAFWTLPNGTEFNVSLSSQTVLDYENSTVSHTLTVTEDFLGEYTFTTTNRRSTLKMSNFTVKAANPPSDLMAVQSGPNSVNVSWTAPAAGGATRTDYRIFFETDSEENITVGAAATSHTLTDLESRETYNISIVALSAILPSELVGPEMVTIEAPNPPSNLTAVQSGPNSVSVSWTAPVPGGPTRTGYRIFIEIDDSEENITVGADATSHTLTDLELGETYIISIVALSAMIPSDVVGPEMVTIEPPNPPADLTAVQSGPNNVSVSWTAPVPGGPTRTGYRIFIETDDSEENITVEADATSHTLTDLELGETYIISIVALSAMIPSDVVGPEMVTIEALNPPADLMAVQSGLNSTNVSWTVPDPVGPTRTGYRIFYETDDSEESEDVGANATSHTLTDLELGETYNISIVAISTILTSEVVGPEVVTIEGRMMPHVLTRVLNSTSIGVTFIQLSGPPAERYDIEYTRVNGAGQRLCPGVRDAGNKTDVPSPYIILADLEEFSNYTFAVTALFFSSMVRLTTEQVEETMHAPPTGFPLNLTLSDSIEATFVNLQWRQVPCIERNGVISNYIVRYGPDGGEMENVTTPRAMRRFTVDGLSPSTNYTFEVAAVNSAGIGPFTLPLIVTTIGEAPPGPVVRVVVFVDTAAMTIVWDQPDPPNGVIQYYELEYCDEFVSKMVNVSHGVRDPLDRFLSRVNRDTSKVLTGLKPDTRYNITITPYNTNLGSLTSFTATTLSIPRVSGYRVMGAFNTTAVDVSWFAVNVAHVDDLNYKLRHHISSRPSNSSTIDVRGMTSAVVIFESPEVAELEHTFSVAVTYKIEDEEFVGEFSVIPQLSDTDVMICDSVNEGSNDP